MKASSPPGDPSEADLIRRAREGDHRAMDALVSANHAAVYRAALTILRDEDAAADVTQDAFLKAFRGLEGFRGEASFKTWLLTIAANEARGALRRAGRRKELALEVAGPVAAPGNSAEERVVFEEERDRVMRHLDELPEKQRQTVILRIFEGLSFREIGVLIDSTEGAARVNYHHGIRRLRERMGGPL